MRLGSPWVADQIVMGPKGTLGGSGARHLSGTEILSYRQIISNMLTGRNMQ